MPTMRKLSVKLLAVRACVSSGQDGRAAGPAKSPSCALTVGRVPDAVGQPDSRIAGGVWDRSSAACRSVAAPSPGATGG